MDINIPPFAPGTILTLAQQRQQAEWEEYMDFLAHECDDEGSCDEWHDHFEIEGN